MRKSADLLSKRLNILLASHGAVADFCKKTGFSRTAVETWRDGESSPTLKNLDVIAESLGVDPLKLLDAETIPESIPGNLLPALLEIAAILPRLHEGEVTVVLNTLRTLAASKDVSPKIASKPDRSG